MAIKIRTKSGMVIEGDNPRELEQLVRVLEGKNAVVRPKKGPQTRSLWTPDEDARLKDFINRGFRAKEVGKDKSLLERHTRDGILWRYHNLNKKK